MTTRKPTLLYLCAVGKCPVYRLGRNTNELLKLCGKHGLVYKQNNGLNPTNNTLTPSKADDIVTPSQSVLNVLADDKASIMKVVMSYRQRLDHIERLVDTPGSNKGKDFLTLWRSTK